MKAGINGVINLSVLDGWWGEGYDGDNGWAIKPAASPLDPTERDREEAATLYEILQDQVVPLYYDRALDRVFAGMDPDGQALDGDAAFAFQCRRECSTSTSSGATGPPRSRARASTPTGGARPANSQPGRRGCGTRGMAWPCAASISRARTQASANRCRSKLPFARTALRADDIVVELVLTPALRGSGDTLRYALVAANRGDDPEETRFVLDLKPDLCGRLDYRIRAYPTHPLLTHPFELGLMRWA